MDSATFVLLSGALTFGVPLLLAMRELKTLGPSGGGGRGPDDCDRDPVPPAPDKPVVVTVQKPLPDCLIPKPMVHVPAPAGRELELV
jgi:hypothetical protein